MERGTYESGEGIVSAMPQPSQPPRTCVSCGRKIDWHANVCPYCGHDYRSAMQPVPVVVKSAKPIVAGALIIIAGLLAIAMGALYLSMDADDFEEAGYTPVSQSEISLEDLEEILNVCGGLEFVFGTIAVLGGVFALMRRHFYLALVGGIFGLVGLGFLVGSLLGLIGVILVALSKDEFEQAAERLEKSEYHY
ncbi:MAG: hypothetical protein JSV90_04205 [Methanobacteriota archaeon]|nr:MAG: hypothetical protein JSV90_04205 [Euryarchaeota archaeon]